MSNEITNETVVTTLEVDARPAEQGTRDYEAAMDKARAASERATSSISDTAAAAAAMGAALIGGIGAASLFVDRILGLNKGLADLRTLALNVGLSLADLQGFKLGGIISGLSEAEINTGLQKSAQLLNDASRNSNTLSKELAENGIAIRNANGQLISQNQLLGIAADLIRRARNPGDQNAIAEMLGFTRAWIPLLEQGSAAMAGLTEEARRAGAIISDETIDRAAEFDRHWRKSSTEFSTYMKAAMLGLLPYVDDLIDRAAKFAKGIDWDRVEKAAQAQLKAGADAVGLPDQAAVKFDLPQSTIDNWNKLGDEIVGIVKAFADFEQSGVLSSIGTLFGLMNSTPPTADDVKAKVSGLMPSMSIVPQNEVKWYAGTSPVMDTSDPTIQAAKAAAAWIAEGDAWKKLSADVMSGADNIAGGFSKVARTGSDTKGAFDRAEEALLKYIETTSAAAASVDKSIYEQERLKAVAQLTAAGIKDGFSREVALAAAETNKMTVAAAQAADALAKARVASQIRFGRETAALSQDDVSIAQQLKGLYPDVATALGSVEAQALRTNNAMRSISSSIGSSLVSGLTDITTGTKTASQGFADMSKTVVRAIEEMVIKLYVIGPLMRGLQSAMGSGSGPMSLGGPNGPTPLPSAHGNVFDGGNVIPFARGGVIERASVAPMALMGEAGPEAIVPLRRGADGNLGIASQGGGKSNVTVTVINQSSQPVSATQEGTNANGDPVIVLRDMVRGVMAEDSANNGPISKGLLARAQGFGGR